MDKKQLYESIMKNVAKEVKRVLNEDNASADIYKQRIDKVIQKFQKIDPEFQNKINLYVFLKMISSDKNPDELINVSKQKVIAWTKKLGKDEQEKIFNIFLKSEKELMTNVDDNKAKYQLVFDNFSSLEDYITKLNVNSFINDYVKKISNDINIYNKSHNTKIDKFKFIGTNPNNKYFSYITLPTAINKDIDGEKRHLFIKPSGMRLMLYYPIYSKTSTGIEEFKWLNNSIDYNCKLSFIENCIKLCNVNHINVEY